MGILLFDDVEVLDFCGPFEVFSVTKLAGKVPAFHVFTCAEMTRPIWARGDLSLNPQYPLHNCPVVNVLVVPGGRGIGEQLNNARLIEWLKSTAARCDIVLSVCTGALLLAKAGLLDGLSATTHHNRLQLLRELAPKTIIREGERVVDNGRIVVAAGISSGIDAALHVVAKLLGEPTARATCEYMEYAWRT